MTALQRDTRDVVLELLAIERDFGIDRPYLVDRLARFRHITHAAAEGRLAAVLPQLVAEGHVELRPGNGCMRVYQVVGRAAA